MQPTTTVGERPGWSSPQSKTITWHDPATALGEASARGLSGLQYLEAMGAGELPFPPIGSLFDMRGVAAREGEVVFELQPDASMLNPMAGVHGGVVCTLLDSVLGCAALTTLPPLHGFTSIEIKISYLRPVVLDGRPIAARGRVTKPGRRVCFTEGEVTDGDGRLVASASSSILVLPAPDGA
jgi:uncharacterized protein (TIGR00369 family)